MDSEITPVTPSIAGQKFIALDIDGTILDESGNISQAVHDSIAEVAAAGHTITIATGRSVADTLPIMRRLDLEPEYVVCVNGAITLQRDPAHPGGYRREFVETFDPRAVLTQIRPYLANAHYAVEDETGFYRYTDNFPEGVFNGSGERVSFDGLLATQATRVVVISPDHAIEEFLAIVEEMGLHRVSYSIGWTAWLDISPDGVNKATALRRVADLLGFPDDVLVSAGDGRNDVEMLEWSSRRGIGAAMGQAPDEVKAAASHVIPSIEDDGLAQLLRSLTTE
ncbi:HAD family hydrolase [Lysinibacter sp. HNR]|uniref:HAD family hydrolase n=1 Tax=Lysinibacter sp. HNR TaxID=3031408 RepID=UPI00243576EA|nr:HAD family hydrolase [Lysinibacter sp. HNR]WGD37545.1 HAD family hydrolase [Lysinibacter sp. HNR]